MNLLARRVSTASLAAVIIVGLLPGAVLAASPAAVAGSVSTAEDTLKSITLTGTDPDGDRAESSRSRPGPGHGTLSTHPRRRTAPRRRGTCTADVDYTPAADYNGPDSFTFTGG